MIIALGSDHVGFRLKNILAEHLRENGFETKDFGCFNEERTDYPVFAETVARAVAGGECNAGILVCGTGIGVSIAANKVRGIRAAVCSEPYSALLSRQHNDSNILALGARVIGEGTAIMIADAWLSGKYEAGRHDRRIQMISDIENGK